MMSYIDLFGIKMDIVGILRDHLYPRCTVGNMFYTGMSVDTKYAQSFIPFSKEINSISVYCNTIGSPSNALTVSVQEDVSGEPSGTMLTSITFTASQITDDDWDTKTCDYTKLISKNKYWLVFESSGQDSSNYYKVGRDTVQTNYQEGTVVESTATWSASSYDTMFQVHTPDWVFPYYPTSTVTVDDLPWIAIDIINRRVDERYCPDGLALADISGLIVVYSQYPDEPDKILSYGERGIFIERAGLTDILLLSPTGLSPVERLRERMYARTSGFNLRKKLKYISTVPTVE